ncbi:ribosome biogenesis protein C1orf109 homolog isoform X1 [Ictalurus punctatus]|uniref:Ribosome biogenesis protein C1orf109 homolog isoform X1 n=1 Tax=Ictalurus punctatus TaxID=7998 RepID=A0A2D0PTU1_ICTPU|nr:ribosome biogenesis protein C1orf109 homolog isoform X1 [Ictalurus punctatus]
MSQPALLQFHQELRKCFQSLKANQTVWNGVLEECTPLLSSLGNLAEQLRALKSVEIANTPLSTFPNLPERLQHKLLNAVDTVLGELSEKVNALDLMRASVCKQVAAVFQMYEQNSELLPISTCVARCALSPSIADMLEWLQDTERYYRMQCIQRKNLLQLLKPDDLTLLETAPKRWTSLDSPRGEDRISDPSPWQQWP